MYEIQLKEKEIEFQDRLVIISCSVIEILNLNIYHHIIKINRKIKFKKYKYI